jgi:hypothetical protein
MLLFVLLMAAGVAFPAPLLLLLLLLLLVPQGPRGHCPAGTG